MTPTSIRVTAAVLMVALALGAFTTLEHASVLGPTLADIQTGRHQGVLKGQAGDPWQYRVLADFLIDPVIRVFERINVRRPERSAYLAFRWMEDTAIFAVAFFYYRRLGLSTIHALLGLSLLAWGMSYSWYDSDLQFNTYFDVLFYLLAGTIILSGRTIWIVPLTFVAALNRETSGFIPFLLVAARPGDARTFVAALAIWIVTFVAVRSILPAQDSIMIPGHPIGLAMLRYNMMRTVTWHRLLATVGILPAVAIAGYRGWPPILRRFFWMMVPAWCAIHAFAAVMAESRLFLVPHALIFVPGVLLFAQEEGASWTNR